jgi:hypothetical protein
MKSKLVSSLLVVALSTALNTFAGPPAQPHVGSAEFEKLKALAGTWQGSTDMGQGPMSFTVQYRVTSGGSVVEERLFADTPKEMLTVYHDKDGKLALTHYCALCNRPAMSLTKAGENSLSFQLTKDSGIDVEKEMHMHNLVLTFDDADHITHEWTVYEGGKPQPCHGFKLERMKK